MGKAIKIGWGKRSIAKEGLVPITGQFYLRVAQGSYTPVLVSALVIENGSDAVILPPKELLPTRGTVPHLIVIRFLPRAVRNWSMKRWICLKN